MLNGTSTPDPADRARKLSIHADTGHGGISLLHANVSILSVPLSNSSGTYISSTPYSPQSSAPYIHSKSSAYSIPKLAQDERC